MPFTTGVLAQAHPTLLVFSSFLLPVGTSDWSRPKQPGGAALLQAKTRFWNSFHLQVWSRSPHSAYLAKEKLQTCHLCAQGIVFGICDSAVPRKPLSSPLSATLDSARDGIKASICIPVATPVATPSWAATHSQRPAFPHHPDTNLVRMMGHQWPSRDGLDGHKTKLDPYGASPALP